MKKLIYTFLLAQSILCCKGATSITNLVTLRSTYSFSSNQFDTHAFPITITNIDGSIVKNGNLIDKLPTNTVINIVSNYYGAPTNNVVNTNVVLILSSNVFYGNGMAGKRIVTFMHNNNPSTTGGNDLGWAHAVAGSAVNYSGTINTQPGLLLYATTTPANSSLYESSGFPFIPPQLPGFFEFRCAMTNVSSVRVWVGLSGQTAVNLFNSEVIPTDCAIFKYSTNSPNWFFYTRGSGTSTTDTGVAATTSMTTFRIVMDGGTSIMAYINGNPVSTNSIGANLPVNVMTPVFVQCPTVTAGKGLIVYNLYGEQPWQ